MKKILVYYYNEEVELQSTNSVARLIASMINYLQDIYEVTYFTFKPHTQQNSANAKQIFIDIPKSYRLQRKINNALQFKRMHWFDLKKKAVRDFVKKDKTQYDTVLVLGLDDVKAMRHYFPGAKILYWIHNISAICKKEYLYNVNDADYFLSPSRTTYHLLLQKLQPVPLSAEFYFVPNWCEDVFKQRNEVLINSLKALHSITSETIVFIFSGSDIKLKGRFILEKAIRKISVQQGKDVLFFFAGSDNKKGIYNLGNIRVTDVGLLQPDTLAAYYQIAMFGCFTSLGYDHCPLTLLEMVHCNVLPIASDMGGVKEILGSGHQFLIKEPHSVTAWVNHIQKAIDFNEDERMQQLIPLKERVITIYNRNAAIEIFENILQSE